MLTKSRMKEHNYCFYNYKEEELFINSSKTKGVYPNIIEKIVEQLDICLATHKRVLVVRFDLHLREYSDDNHTISKFINRLKEKIFKLKKYRRIKDIGHVWVREVETVKTQHYHVALFLDGNKIQHPSALLQYIKAKWFKHGHCHIPENCFYYIDKYNLKDERALAIKRLSYLAKTRGKGYKGKQAKNYSVSRLCK